MSNQPKPPFKKLDRVYVTRAGFPQHPIGTTVTVATIVNQGTRKNPNWRLYGSGLWFHPEDVSVENPVGE